jgi:uncharacterized protein (UPF0276 family)
MCKGVGLAWRPEFFKDRASLLEEVDFLEWMPETIVYFERFYPEKLQELRQVPWVIHSTQLSIGSDHFDFKSDLADLVALKRKYDVQTVSEHLSWTASGRLSSQNFYPIFLNASSFRHVLEKVSQIQEALGCRISLENVVNFFKNPEVSIGEALKKEAIFLAEVVKRTGCTVLLDVSNLVINGSNLREDPATFLSSVGAPDIEYMHIAGYQMTRSGVLVDSHMEGVAEDSWGLLRDLLRLGARRAVVLERDNESASTAELIAELRRLRLILESPSSVLCRIESPFSVEKEGTFGEGLYPTDQNEGLVSRSYAPSASRS